MSLANRVAKLESRRKKQGAGPCLVCWRKRDPDIDRLATSQLEQWQWIWADVFADQVALVTGATKDLLCPRCRRCSLGYTDCAEAYYLANQDSQEDQGDEEDAG